MNQSVSRTAQPPLKILFANVYGYFQKDLKSVSEFSMINEGQYGSGSSINLFESLSEGSLCLKSFMKGL